MNFDRVAALYRWLEAIVFGDQLQKARVAFIGRIETPHRVLVIGEGDGRFLAEFVRAHPAAAVDCVEASARMIALARDRVPAATVKFIHSNLAEATLSTGRYDLIVTHFFLDCFVEESLARAVVQLASAAAPNASWLVADFCCAPRGWRRWRARILIAAMYAFFRFASGIEARRLVDYRPLLRAQGFALEQTILSPNEMIRSELWRR